MGDPKYEIGNNSLHESLSVSDNKETTPSSDEVKKEEKDAYSGSHPLYIHYQNLPDDILSISPGSDWSPATPVKNENEDNGELRMDSLRMFANLRKEGENKQ